MKLFGLEKIFKCEPIDKEDDQMAENTDRVYYEAQTAWIEQYKLMSSIREWHDAFVVKCVWHGVGINTITVGDGVGVITSAGIQDVANRTDLIEPHIDEENSICTYKAKLPISKKAERHLVEKNQYLEKLIAFPEFLEYCHCDIGMILEWLYPTKAEYAYLSLPPLAYFAFASDVNRGRIHIGRSGMSRYTQALLEMLFNRGTAIISCMDGDLYSITGRIDVHGKWRVVMETVDKPNQEMFHDLILESTKYREDELKYVTDYKFPDQWYIHSNRCITPRSGS